MFGASGHVWSLGTLTAFAALPETGQITEGDGLILSSEGCLARLRPDLPPEARLLAFETLSSDPRGWNHGIALCLPVTGAAPSGVVRTVRDDDPILDAHRGRPVLDLGLGQGASRALFRPPQGQAAEASAVEGMVWAKAAPLLAQRPGTWIIDTPVLRVERSTAEGIGLHSVPQAVMTGRSHAETTPVPEGLIPVAHVFPPHPARHAPGAPMAFDPARHVWFQAILEGHGRPDLWALKAEVLAQLATGRCDPPQTDRHGAAVLRIALRQHLHLHGTPPHAWLERFDRPLLRALEEGGA